MDHISMRLFVRFFPQKRIHSETRVFDWRFMNLFRQRNSLIASPASFRALYELNRLPVFRYIYALTGGSQADAEDLTAETFLRAWKARHQFHGEMDSAIGWLIRIAKSLVIDNYRRTVRATRNLPLGLDATSTPEQTAIHEEQQKLLLRLVADLPDEQREIIVLRYLLGWRVNDIARHLGDSENKISVSLHRTLSKLREKWTEADSDNHSAMFIQKETTYESHT
jgi:RNA polymerase sigma-70 factor (ECF subfamily)